MLGTAEFEKIFYLYIRNNPKYFKTIPEGFFENSDVDILYDITKKFFMKFKEIPSKDQLKLIAQSDKSKLSSPIIDMVFEENLAEYDEKWLKDQSEAWIRWKSYNESLKNMVTYSKSIKITTENILDVVNKAKSLFLEKNSINFDNDLGLDFFNPESHIQYKDSKIKTGHNWVDNLSDGGYDLKTLVVYAGEQNIGKSIWLANDAVNFVKSGYDVAFISAEMADRKVVRRLGANMLNIPMAEYDKKSRDTAFMTRRLQQIQGGMIPPGRLFVKEYPTSQATVLDIEAYLRDLEETQGIKLKVIVIDYINILCNYRNPNSENTYLTIKHIAQDLRAMAKRNNWLIITATQINRGGYDASDISMKDIAESAGLSHTADMIYGIIQDTTMHINEEYWLKVLKIRDGHGKNSKCKYTIDYNYMRLYETEEIMQGNIAA